MHTFMNSLFCGFELPYVIVTGNIVTGDILHNKSIGQYECLVDLKNGKPSILIFNTQMIIFHV